MIQVGNIDFRRGDFHLQIDGFTVNRGEKVAVLGENGSGKSTLMHLMTGVLGSADVQYDNVKLQNATYELRAKIFAFLPQMPEVSFPFTVAEVVGFGRYPMGEGCAKDEATTHCMKNADVYHLRDRIFSELSGGEKRRVMFARVINQGTQVQILDEPVSMLDIRHRLEILELVVNSDKTVVTSIHDVNLACEYFDRLIFLKQGRLIHDLRKDDVTPAVISEVFDVKVSGDTGHFSFYL